MKKFFTYLEQLKAQKKLSNTQIYLTAFGILLFLSLALTLPNYLIKQQQILKSQAQVATSTYYVNPTGNDSNPGTQAAPWKTFRKAATTLVAGDTAIFADGTYIETQQVVIANNGTASEPITFKSQNKHGAVITFHGVTQWGHLYSRKSYATIQDFEITQTTKGTTAADVLVYFDNTTGVLKAPRTTGNKFLGNKCHGAFFNCLKMYGSDNFIADGNEVYDSDGLAMEATAADNPIFRNNVIYDVTTQTPGSGGIIYMKGGVKSGQMYNNVVRILSGQTASSVMILGGTTSANAVDNTSTSGYECFNCGAWNNVIIAEDIGSATYGYFMVGCQDCGLFNNIIRGAVWNIRLQRGAGDLSNGWVWEPKTRNPVLKNNILLECSPGSCVYLGSAADTEGTVTHDYNLFYNSSGSPSFPSEPHGVYAHPQLVNVLSDWHLQPGSPAIGAGNPNTFIGYFGESIDVSKDKDGVQRVSPWDMGIYAYTTSVATPTLTPTPTCTATALNVSSATSDGGYAYIIAGPFGTPADNSSFPARSLLRMFENGVETGPAHAVHVDIRNLGAGRFSHWSQPDGTDEYLRFSATNNTDPRTNGKSYTYCLGNGTPTPTLTSIPTPTNTPIPTPTNTPTPLPTATPTPVADTIKPTVSITTPANGSTVKRRTNISVQATASDNVKVTKVEFRRNGSLICTDTTVPFSCSMYTHNNQGVTVTYAVQAYDATGNTASHSISVVTIK